MDVATFRQQMPITAQWAYLDHAAVAPLSAPARSAITAWVNEAAGQGDVVWADWARRVEEVRAAAARLLGCRPTELAFVPNTTAGISLIAEGYPWQAGDNVVTLANEFPSNLYPWVHLATRGVETRRVPVEGPRVDWPRVMAACDQRTRLLALSWVGYSTGWRLDLDQVLDFAAKRRIQVFLDAIQGLGVFPLDVRRFPVDFLAADGHKWLLGPEGAGLLYVRQDRLDLLRPLGVGWHSVVHAHDFSRIELQLRPDAARYEGGSQNMVGVLGLGASLDLLLSLGLAPDRSPLADRVLEFTDELCRRICGLDGEIHSARDDRHRSGIVSFSFAGRDPQALRQACLAAGVVLSCRGGRLRASPHAYGDEDDLVRLVDALQHALGRS